MECVKCQKPVIKMGLPTDLRRYLILSTIYVSKYVSVFKLHMAKHLMKMDIDCPDRNRTFGVNGDNAGDDEGLSFADEVNLNVDMTDLTDYSIPRYEQGQLPVVISF